ncbi:MAG: hypothetical protein JNM77_16390 [Pseudonocardia sp.]|nr:hypothetical protein [Pseudonocardia sp.]
MTSPEGPELERVRNWSAGLGAALGTVAGEVGDLGRRIAAGWPDHHGREWSERLLTLRTGLERAGDAAARLAQAADRGVDGPVGPATGPRLGGTAARRAADERGVRIPRLDDPEDG